MRGSNARTDAGVLRGAAYATTDNLFDRAPIYAYRTGPLDVVPWDVMMEALAVVVHAEIEQSGSFAITTDTGVFCCSAPR